VAGKRLTYDELIRNASTGSTPREDRERGEKSESADRLSSNAMKLLKNLARRLVDVPELQQQQERYDVENAASGENERILHERAQDHGNAVTLGREGGGRRSSG